MILITGSTGFIGRELTQDLLSKGYPVRVLVRNYDLARKMFPRAEVLRADIQDRDSLKIALKEVTKVVHLAGIIDYKNRKRIFETNYQGTKNVIDCCKGVDRFIFSSSVAAFGRTNGKANESTVCHPTDPYGESKLMAEKLVKKSDMDHAILRMTAVYGAGSPWFYKILGMLTWGIPCPNTDNMVQLVHVSDVVQAIELSLNKGRGTFIIADKKPVKLAYITKRLVNLLGKRYWTVPPWMMVMPAKLIGMGALVDLLMEDRNYDITKAQRVLGFKPKADMEYELKRMVEDYLRNK